MTEAKSWAELWRRKPKIERSAGELSLLIMGIKKAAYELLIENPIIGNMKEIKYSPMLG